MFTRQHAEQPATGGAPPITHTDIDWKPPPKLADMNSSDHVVERVIIGVMTEDDLVTALGWAQEEGWIPGVEDAKAFQIADRDGFLMAKTEKGEPMSSISAVRFGDNYGFIGLHITARRFRGRGHGTAVFREAMRHLEGRVIGLDAVAAQQASYAKHGFVLAHQTVRFGGAIAVDTSTTSSIATTLEKEDDRPHRLVVQALQHDNMDLVLAFDNEHVFASRPEFIRAWLAIPGHIARVATSTENGGEINGYGVLRPCDEGAKIGPLFASSAEVADLLARELAAASISSTGSTAAEAVVVLDVPEPNVEGIRLAERLGLSRVCETGRMYRGPAPKLPLERIFGVTTLELG